MVSIVCLVMTVSPVRDDPLFDLTADDAPTAGDNSTRAAAPVAPALLTMVSFPSQNPGSNESSLSFSASSELGVNFGSKPSDAFVIDRSRIDRMDAEADGEGMGCVLTRPGSDRAAESGADFLRERVSDGVRIFFLAMVTMCDTERSLRIVCVSVNGI